MLQLNDKELEKEERENKEPKNIVSIVADTLWFLMLLLNPWAYIGFNFILLPLAVWICVVKDKLGGWSPIISALGILTVVGVYCGFPEVRPFIIGVFLFILLIWWMLWFAKRQTKKMKK